MVTDTITTPSGETVRVRTAQARTLAESLSGYGHAIPQPVTPEWIEQAAAKGMVRKADLVDGGWYIGCCRNAYMARWFANGVQQPRVRWALSYEGQEHWRSKVLSRVIAEHRVGGARRADDVCGGNGVHWTATLHAADCEDPTCPGLDAEGGCRHPTPDEPVRGTFIHLREKFGSVFSEAINHPEDDDGWDLFVPTMLALT